MPQPRRFASHWLLALVLGAASILTAAALFSFRATSWQVLVARRSADARVALHRVFEALLDAETGQRGYLLTGDQAYLAPYERGRRVLGERLDAVERFLGASDRAASDRLMQLSEAKLGITEHIVRLASSGQTERALALVRSGRGNLLMEEIRALVTRLDAEVGTRLEAQRSEANRRDRWATIIIGSAALAVTAGLAIGWGVRRNLLQRERGDAERQAILDDLPVGVTLIDARSRAVVYANREAIQINGGPFGAVPTKAGPDVPTLLRPDGATMSLEEMPVSRALAGERVVGSELVLRRAGKPDVPLLNNAVPVRANDVPMALLAFVDISSQKAAEIELRTAYAEMKATFDQAAVGIAHVGLDGRWLRVNDKVCELLGYSRAELTSRTFQELTHPEELDADVALLRKVLSGEMAAYTLEKRYLRKDERTLWANLTVALVRRPDGQPAYFISIIQDVSDRRRAEEELAALNQTLEQRIEERTLRLTELNEELEAFSYSVSHDLRAPLRAISGYCQILAEEHGGALDDAGREVLGRARAAATRMGLLIDDMLELSRVTRSEIRRETVDLSRLAEQVVAELRGAARERADTIVDVEPGLRVVGDGRLLHTALSNLLSNAWKFTAKTAAPRIQVASTRRGDERVFCVRDNGVGFDARYTHRLFAPFQRLHAQAAFEGTGIGLATVKRVINKHGGRVWIDRAAPGEGVTVSFTLGQENA